MRKGEGHPARLAAGPDRALSPPGGSTCQLQKQKNKSVRHGVSQDLETTCPKLAIVVFGRPIFSREATMNSDFNLKNMHLLIEIRHNNLIPCQRNCIYA